MRQGAATAPAAMVENADCDRRCASCSADAGAGKGCAAPPPHASTIAQAASQRRRALRVMEPSAGIENRTSCGRAPGAPPSLRRRGPLAGHVGTSRAVRPPPVGCPGRELRPDRYAGCAPIPAAATYARCPAATRGTPRPERDRKYADAGRRCRTSSGSVGVGQRAWYVQATDSAPYARVDRGHLARGRRIPACDCPSLKASAGCRALAERAGASVSRKR